MKTAAGGWRRAARTLQQEGLERITQEPTMTRTSLFLAALVTLTIAGTAAAADTRWEHLASAPRTTDEARALAGARLPCDPAVAPSAELTARMPSSTDEARALAAERTRQALVVASPRTSAARSDRSASSTDEARARAAERKNPSMAGSTAGRESLCAR